MYIGAVLKYFTFVNNHYLIFFITFVKATNNNLQW